MKILIVEDDPLIRESIATSIRELGHTVVEAKDGAEALHILYPDGDMDTTINAVITDMQMPNVSGLELLQRISKQDSRVPCLLQSSAGYCVVEKKMTKLSDACAPFNFAKCGKKGDPNTVTNFLQTL